jgi:hypothetical protein
MEHKRLDQLRSVADVQKDKPTRTLSRQERIDRWIHLLERDPHRRLTALDEIEYKPAAERALVRADNSPISVALADPMLRSEGLEGDRLGDALNFFEMTEHQAHHALCSCLGGRTMDAAAFAQRLRGATGGFRVMSGAWVAFGLAIALPSLLFLFE